MSCINSNLSGTPAAPPTLARGQLCAPSRLPGGLHDPFPHSPPALTHAPRPPEPSHLSWLPDPVHPLLPSPVPLPNPDPGPLPVLL